MIPPLDARVLAWWNIIQCKLYVRPSLDLYASSATASATCANVDIIVRVAGADLRAASVKLGEFLRLLHAASARPVRCPSYDWLQQLLWPNVCTLPQCRCCYDGDRRMTLKLSCTTHQLVPLPQVVSGSLFEWTEANASAEYKALMAAIQQEAGGAQPENPLNVVVEVLPLLCRLPSITKYRTSTKSLLQDLSEKRTSDCFHIGAVSASFTQRLAPTNYKKILKTLATSKLPLALPAFSPLTIPCGSSTSMYMWLFHHRALTSSLALTMPVVVDLRMRSTGAPSARVFTEFCAWLATNDALKVLVIDIPTQLVASSLEMWEDLGFALFSPFSKLNLRRLELNIHGITDGDIDSVVSGSQRLCLDSQQGGHVNPSHSSHDMFKLTSFGISTAALIKVIRHFGHAVHEFDVRVDEDSCLLVLQAIMESSPALRDLRVCVFRAPPNQLTTDGSSTSTCTAPTPKTTQLRSLTIFDDTDSGASQVISQILELVGQMLSLLCVSNHTTTNTLADTILSSCPVLESLAVNRAEASFWERLSEGYSSGGCTISELSIGEATRVPSPWVYDLVQTLTNRASPFTRAMKKLEFRSGAYSLASLAALQHTLLEMLDKNPFLVQLVLPTDFSLGEAARVRHGEIVANASHPLHPHQRSAVLSCSPRIANGMVPREIWRLILDLSARPARRKVVVMRR